MREGIPDRNFLRQLNALFNRRDRILFALLAIMALIAAGLEVVGLGVIPVLIAIAASPDRALETPFGEAILVPLGIDTTQDLIIWGSLAVIAIIAIKNSYLVLNQYLQLRIAKNRQAGLAARLFRAYMYAPYEFHLQRNSSDLASHVKLEVQQVCNGVLVPLMRIVTQSVMVVAIVCTLISVEPLLSMMTLATMGIVGGGFMWWTQRRLRRIGDDAQEHRRLSMRVINQGFGCLRELRFSAGTQMFVRELAIRELRVTGGQRFKMLASYSTACYLETVAVATLLCVVVGLVLQGRALESLAPTVVLFGAAMVRLKAATSGLSTSYMAVIYGAASVRPVYEDLMLLEETTKSVGHHRSSRIAMRGKIEFQGVGYRYPESDTDVIHEVDLSVARGESLGLVGGTGSGKSTLIGVMIGLLPPTRGRVLVDGQDIHQNVDAWQAAIGYVPQEVNLIDDSILRNIALGADEADIDERAAHEAVRVSQLSELVSGLPDGLQTVVGENGMRLSGGQRQRIGIARALYKNPDMLVLDEGTSALDEETEGRVIAAISETLSQCTTVMIAHRPNSLRHCDRVLHVVEGRVAWSGSYEDMRSDFHLGNKASGSVESPNRVDGGVT